MSEIRVISCVWMRIRHILLGDLVEEAVHYYLSFFFCILFAMLNGQAGCRDDVGSLLQGRRLSMQLSYSHSVQDAPVHYTVTHTPVE